MHRGSKTKESLNYKRGSQFFFTGGKPHFAYMAGDKSLLTQILIISLGFHLSSSNHYIAF